MARGDQASLTKLRHGSMRHADRAAVAAQRAIKTALAEHGYKLRRGEMHDITMQIRNTIWRPDIGGGVSVLKAAACGDNRRFVPPE